VPRVPLSRRDILRIARRFNAGKRPAYHTSPEGTADLRRRLAMGIGRWVFSLSVLPSSRLSPLASCLFNRPFGTPDLLASNPALKRWAILDCPFGTAKIAAFEYRQNNPGVQRRDLWVLTRVFHHTPGNRLVWVSRLKWTNPSAAATPASRPRQAAIISWCCRQIACPS